MKRGEAKKLRALIESMSSTLDDETALTGVALFPRWVSGTAYAVDFRVQHEGTLYRCVQAHTSQEDWTPDAVPALWTVVSVEEYPQWVQPTGAHDAYAKGAKVTYNGAHWVCDVDGNTWAPDVYGWTKE